MKNKNLLPAIITAIATIIAAVITSVYFKNTVSQPETSSISGTIIEEGSGKSISYAKISVVGRNEDYYSEENGNFYIVFKDINVKEARLRVTKDPNYFPYDKSYDVPSNSVIIVIKKK